MEQSRIQVVAGKGSEKPTGCADGLGHERPEVRPNTAQREQGSPMAPEEQTWEWAPYCL